MKNHTLTLEHSELGKQSDYSSTYNPDKLFPIARKIKRDEIGVPAALPFFGFDLWNHYEVSWLNEKGKPIAALAEICYPCDTDYIIESKSMKLYFNSFNNTKFKDEHALQEIIKKDIEDRIFGEVFVKITLLNNLSDHLIFANFEGKNLDLLDIECTSYRIQQDLLKTEGEKEIEETVYSHLLKSNCLITNQPDWASIQIAYTGKKINHEGLLQYIVSFRNHNEFHEQCIERIFMDIMNYCNPKELTVYGRYTRRGGLEINPYRSTQKIKQHMPNLRLCRQ